MNKLSIKMGAANHGANKDFIKSVDLHQRLHHFSQNKKPILPDDKFIYGLPSPKNENISNIINYTYGNKAEEIIRKEYEDFIQRKSKIIKTPKVVPRFISPKVEEMKKKEEERKANSLDEPIEEEKKEEKPLYKLKMFMNVGSKVAEGIKAFKSYKPFNVKKSNKIKNEDNKMDKIINDVKDDIEKKETIEKNELDTIVCENQEKNE